MPRSNPKRSTAPGGTLVERQAHRALRLRRFWQRPLSCAARAYLPPASLPAPLASIVLIGWCTTRGSFSS